MRTKFEIVLSTMLASATCVACVEPAFSQGAARDRCLFAAAERLPKAPGLEVVSSDVQSSSADTFRIVFFVKFAGQTSARTYICSSTGIMAPPFVMEMP